MVFGVVNDKDLSKIFPILKKNKHFSGATYYFCKPNIPRGLDVAILQKEANKYGLKGETYNSVKEALNTAKKTAISKELVFVGGSTFTVADAI